MIFKIRNKAEPKIGDMKIVKKFAWLPMKIDSTTIIWLEKYYIKYKVYSDYYGEKYWSVVNCWIKTNKKYI